MPGAATDLDCWGRGWQLTSFGGVGWPSIFQNLGHLRFRYEMIHTYSYYIHNHKSTLPNTFLCSGRDMLMDSLSYWVQWCFFQRICYVGVTITQNELVILEHVKLVKNVRRMAMIYCWKQHRCIWCTNFSLMNRTSVGLNFNAVMWIQLA